MTPDLIAEIETKRSHQHEKYGGVAHDDMHTPNDWIVLIARHASKGAAYPACKDVSQITDEDAANFRSAMLDVVALGVAAIEYADRYVGAEIEQ
jgi:hypothetical protein